jgi:NAD(P)H-flavin reductase
VVDAQRLKSSFAVVAQHGDEVPLFFYASLFLSYPETRDMFPVAMAGQRDKLVNALGYVVSNVDNLDDLAPFLQQLGRDHRKFAVAAEHYPAVGSSLLATLEHFLGADWTPELAADWEAAFGLVASVMKEAAETAATTTPPWWDAEVVSHERRTLDIAVIRLRTAQPLGWVPGQSIALETEMRPRLWRYFSPSHVEREDGLIEIHVRLVARGPVSPALVQSLQPGDVLRLGSPVGTHLTLQTRTAGDLVLVAGGTGLAPLRALVDQLVQEEAAGAATVRPQRVMLVHGARSRQDLYDLPQLTEWAARLNWLFVVPVVSEDPTYDGEQGLAIDAALRRGPWLDPQVYVCGSPAMVAGSVDRLVGAGITPESIHFEDFSNHTYAGSAEPMVGGEEATHDHAH